MKAILVRTLILCFTGVLHTQQDDDNRWMGTHASNYIITIIITNTITFIGMRNECDWG